MSTSDEGTLVEVVQTGWLWGPCDHADASKLLIATGEERPVTRTLVEVEPGVQVPVDYVQPDAPVTYLATTICAECGNHQVWESTSPICVPDEAPPPPPPPPAIDVTGMTCRPAPSEETP